MYAKEICELTSITGVNLYFRIINLVIIIHIVIIIGTIRFNFEELLYSL